MLLLVALFRGLCRSSFVDDTGKSTAPATDLDWQSEAKRLAIHLEVQPRSSYSLRSAHMACSVLCTDLCRPRLYTLLMCRLVMDHPVLAGASCRE
jgi:hypothetical protein